MWIYLLLIAALVGIIVRLLVTSSSPQEGSLGREVPPAAEQGETHEGSVATATSLTDRFNSWSG